MQLFYHKQPIKPMAFLVCLFLTILTARLKFCTAQTHVYDECLGGNYTANSMFQVNLNLLLTSISDNSTPRNTRFYNTSVGKNPDIVHGRYQCRVDYSLADCRRFAAVAAKEVTNGCPYKKEAVVYYNEITFHYSDKSFSLNIQNDPFVWLCSTTNVSNPNIFGPKKDDLMGQLVDQAASDSINMFATGENNLTIAEKIYGLVQCRQDLSTSNCKVCLSKVIFYLSGFCTENPAGSVFTRSCSAMFNNSKFFVSESTTQVLSLAAPSAGQMNKSSRNVVQIVLPVIIIVLLLSVITIFFRLRGKKGAQMVKAVDASNHGESLQLKFAVVERSTGNFCDANKLGEGGFGAVYQGKLQDGRAIAVKRLSRSSVQGVEEFKNEVILLSKVEHRNLVRLLGFSIEGDEKLLIYEFVPNGSLDNYLFDPLKLTYLDWEARYKIIRGVARGLLYLHEDSPSMIIHRDLKAGNILLDEEMNPKIADFGMAKLCVVDQTHGFTTRVVGTYGYMAPEYASHGHFSVKSDVFSLGVVVLEIISGRKNNRYYESQGDEFLLSNAWKHLLKGTAFELLEPALGENYSQKEVLRCIHIGLLCVQQDVIKRPSMASVFFMLNRNSVTLPLPSAPAFFVGSAATNVDMVPDALETNSTSASQSTLPEHSISGSTVPSVNEVSITELYPR